MTDSPKSGTASQAPPAAATPKKKGTAKAAAKPKTLATKGEKKVASASHPTSAKMVVEAINKLAEKSGSSLQAIKKSIADTHKVDLDKQGSHINKALKKLVETGELTQVTGKGASGSFKLAAKAKPAKKAAAAEKKQTKAKDATKKKPAAAKKAVSPNKKTAAPKAKKDAKPAPAAAKKTTSAAKPKTGKKAAAAKPKSTTAAEKKPKKTTAAAATKPAKGGKTRAAPKDRSAAKAK